MNKIITIGREFGSGGRELGKRLSQLLGFAYYDNEIITEISKRTALSEEYVNAITEHRPIFSYPIHFGNSFNAVNNHALQQNIEVFRAQSDVIKEMAEKSDCVIVGRCADYILRGEKPYRIFVYADENSKIARCREKAGEHEHLSDKQLKRYIKAVDKNRAQYYRFHTENKWGARENYDLCVNTSNTPVKDLAEMLSHLFF